MGYTPRIFVDYDDLNSHRQEIEEKAWSKSEDQDAYSTILNDLNSEPLKFRNVKITQICCDLTSKNTKIRRILHDMDVYFTVDY